MFYVYVLKSKKGSSLYVGSTNDLQRRFKEHNQKLVNSTRLKTPWVLVYYEAYTSEKDARTREHQIKKFSGAYTHLKRRIKNSIILSK